MSNTISTILLLALLSASSAPSSRAATTTASEQQQQLASVSVQTSAGRLLGSRHTLKLASGTNATVYRFLGVPYAMPPVGQLRFKLPRELNSSSERLLDATRYASTCPQFRHLERFVSPLLNVDQQHQTSEDCLHLNLFVPSSVAASKQAGEQLEPKRKLPVIVWIPGEGFDFADARQFDGSYLAHKSQALVVSVQYRVGVLGFLRASELEAPGNMGLHDQLAALRWLQANLEQLGGDPERVTLMGRFSGAMSISALISAPQQELLLSQAGRPMFSRAAMLSGVAVPNWIIESQSQAETRFQELKAAASKRTLCAQLSASSCLRELPVEQLLADANYGWRLVVDQQLVGPESPAEAVRANRLHSGLEAVLLGETSQEGTLCLYRHLLEPRSARYAKLIERDQLTTADLYEIVRDDSLAYYRDASAAAEPIRAAIETLGEQQPEGANLRDKYLAACSAFMVKSHALELKRNILARNQYANNRLQASRKPVELFHYELRYKPTFSLAPDYIKTAAHGDDVPLIFGLVYSQSRRDQSEHDLLMTRKLMAYVANFVHGQAPLQGRSNSLTLDLQAANETSMDESEQQLANDSQLVRRNFTSEASLEPMELTEADLAEISAKTQQTSRAQTSKTLRTSLRVVVVENPELAEEATLSQHRRLQVPDELYWRRLQASSPAVSQQASPQVGGLNQLASESPLVTVLLFSSCLVSFALTSLCFGLCLVLFRRQLSQKQHFACCTTNSCNLCDQSQRATIEAVLEAGSRKDARTFGNVFAKLRNHHQQQQPARASNNPAPAASNHSAAAAATD